jgi:hypothetical protein
MQCRNIKSHSLSFGIGFFFKYIKYFAFVAEKKMKKHIFLMNCRPKKFNFQMPLNSTNVYQ